MYTRTNHRWTKQSTLGARLINFPQNWSEQRTHGASNFLCVRAKSLQISVRGEQYANCSQMAQCRFTLPSTHTRIGFANHSACSCVRGFTQDLTIKYLGNIFHWRYGCTTNWWTQRVFVYAFLNIAGKFRREPCILSVSGTLYITMSKVENYELYRIMLSLDHFQHHILIKFFQKWEKLGKETFYALCVVYGDNVMLKSLFFAWYKYSNNGREEYADAPWSDRPASICNAISIVKVKVALHDDHRQSLRDITEALV